MLQFRASMSKNWMAVASRSTSQTLVPLAVEEEEEEDPMEVAAAATVAQVDMVAAVAVIKVMALLDMAAAATVAKEAMVELQVVVTVEPKVVATVEPKVVVTVEPKEVVIILAVMPQLKAKEAILHKEDMELQAAHILRAAVKHMVATRLQVVRILPKAKDTVATNIPDTVAAAIKAPEYKSKHAKIA